MDEVALRIKTWWSSVIIWLQGMVVAVAALGDMLPFVSQYMPDSPVLRWLVGAIAVATIYLRLFQTNQAVTVSAAIKPVTGKVVTPAEVAEIKAEKS